MTPDAGYPLLSIVVFLPLAGALAAMVLRGAAAVRWLALVTTLLALVASIPLWIAFDRGTHAFQFVEEYAWIPTFNVNYVVGVDGISLLLVLLTTFLSPIVVLCSWRAIDKRVKEFMMAVLLMETEIGRAHV